jgi:hypothetical protein
MAEVSTDILASTELGVIHESSIIAVPPPISDAPRTINNDTDADTSTNTSTNATPVHFCTPAGAILVPGRDRNRSVVTRPNHQQFPPRTPIRCGIQ